MAIVKLSRGHISLGLVCVACLFAVDRVSAATEVIKFIDSGDRVTQEFEVQAPWLLNWSLATDYPKQAGLHVALLDSLTGLHEGEVITKSRNFVQERPTGVILFRKSGTFQFRFDSNLAKWVLHVQELTEEEAEQYAPARKRISTDWIR